jgi:hypothetical protein
VAEEHDVQVALHTDGLNEAGCAGDTLNVAGGRVFHAFHVEGCGGGHAPDVLTLAGRAEVITSSTNPTLPFGRDALAEHFDMIALVHGLDASTSSEPAGDAGQLGGRQQPLPGPDHHGVDLEGVAAGPPGDRPAEDLAVAGEHLEPGQLAAHPDPGGHRPGRPDGSVSRDLHDIDRRGGLAG